MKPGTHKLEHQRQIFAMRQVRDCVAGSDRIKRAGEMYLPMPSGMRYVTDPASVVTTGSTNPLSPNRLSESSAPWFHSNAAYSAYVHRAKFPDITQNTLRGLVGIGTRNSPEVDLPGGLSYLEEVATVSGDCLDELFGTTLSEVFQVGRHALVLDVRSDNTFYIAQYSSESYINWRVEVINGKKIQTYAEFETVEVDTAGEEHQRNLVYSLEAMEENGPLVCMIYNYLDGKPDVDRPPVPFLYQGKPLERLPVFNIGAEENTPEPDAIPLIGVSDCALDVYRHSADLNHAHFMTCNPTLVFTGVDEDDAPRTIGSTVAVCLAAPDARAHYLATDTSALGHVKEYIQDVFQEAIQYGASLLGPAKRAAESAEALSLRQSASGATLVTVVSRVGAGIEAVLQLASDLATGGQEVVFVPNTEFAEISLTAPDILALLNSWMSGGISRQTFLENLSAAGVLAERTPEEEANLIDEEGILPSSEPDPAPSLAPGDDDEGEEDAPQ